MSITRLFLPLYFYGCPSNFLHIEPNYTMVKIIFIWVFTQIAIIICQDKYGPRFFIPKTVCYILFVIFAIEKLIEIYFSYYLKNMIIITSLILEKRKKIVSFV